MPECEENLDQAYKSARILLGNYSSSTQSDLSEAAETIELPKKTDSRRKDTNLLALRENEQIKKIK